MNKIVQLKSANNDNIYPVSYSVGGTKLDLLWTNPNPSSTFGAQTISLDLSGYSAVYIEVCYSIGAVNSIGSGLVLKNSKGLSIVCGTSPWLIYRNCDVNNNGIIFSTGYGQNGNETLTSNDHGVPVKIYGIKTAWIVPTEVNGMQYVEVE